MLRSNCDHPNPTSCGPFWLLSVALLVGCANTAPATLSGHPKFGAETNPIVVIGYFTDPKHLDAGPCPTYSTPEGLNVDCFGPYPSAMLTVYEVLFGQVPASRVQLLADSTEHPERFPTGRGKPQLIFLEGYSFAGGDTTGYLSGYRPLVKLQSGELAVPVATSDDLPDLPCSGERLLHSAALQFAEPVPTRPLDEYTKAELASLRESGRVRFRGNALYFDYGVTLSAIRKAIEEMAQDDLYDPCWE